MGTRTRSSFELYPIYPLLACRVAKLACKSTGSNTVGPRRRLALKRFERRTSNQIGLAGEAVQRYVNDWIVGLENVTPIAHRIADAVKRGVMPDNLPDKLERPYPLSSALLVKLARTILST